MKSIKVFILNTFCKNLLQKNRLKIKAFFCFFLLIHCLIAQPIIEWEKDYGGSDGDRAFSIQQTNYDGYIVAGRTFSPQSGDVGGNNGLIDYWINDVGNIEWESTYGGSGEDIAYSILQTIDGGFIIADSSGSRDGDVGDNNGSSDFWIVKLAPFQIMEEPCTPPSVGLLDCK